MSKFSKGDKARVISVDDDDINEGVHVGDIVTVSENDSYFPWVELPNGETYTLQESQMEHYTETPKEITLNGTTYVIKEELNPEHEWKFGDIATHPDYGVGMVFSESDGENDVMLAHNGDWDWADIKDLTFLRRADLSV